MQKSASWKEILKLSLPTVMTYLGIMLMQVVDLTYVGRISPAATAAFGFSNSIYSWFLVSGIGLFSALDFMISYRRGTTEFEEGELALGNAVWLCLIIGGPITWLLIELGRVAGWMGLEPAILQGVHEFHFWLALSWAPTLLGCIFRSYAQAWGHVRILAGTLFAANIVNWFLNELLVVGRFGWFEPMGVRGAGISTFWARVFMLAVFWWGVTYGVDGIIPRAVTSWRMRLRWRPTLIREIFRIGTPSAFQFAFEVGAFATAGTISNLLGATVSASHQIVINMASVAFMIPHGIGTAASAMIGKRYGEGDLAGAKLVGNRCIQMVLIFMTLTSLTFLIFPGPILGIYSADPEVHRICKTLLVWVAFFQLADGIQGMLSGALRGLGDTAFSMWSNLICHWVVGLPTGALFCFWILRAQAPDQRIVGLWAGLTIGLIGVASCLLWRWRKIFKILGSRGLTKS